MTATQKRTMLSRLHKFHDDTEDGFTLIEILVVILIIGILSAIAIPVFLNQRKTANDAAVKSDVRNVALAIETGFVGNHDANFVENSNAVGGAKNIGQTGEVWICLLETQTSACKMEGKVILSEGVFIDISGGPDSFLITGYHSNGSKYTAVGKSFNYRSGDGGARNAS